MWCLGSGGGGRMCVRVWCVVWFQGMVAVMRVVWADGQWWRASAGASDADASAAGASAQRVV